MSTIKVPVINEAPNTITVTFPSEYSVSFEAANPDGLPTHTSVGGPGVLGGPEFVNLLQRANSGLSGVGQTGYAVEQFQLAQYPNHTFYSFKNFTTGAKNVVAFNTTLATTAAVPTGLSGGTGAIAGATAGASGATSIAQTFSTPMTDTVGASFVWGGDATVLGSVTSGQGTTAMKFTAAKGASGVTGNITMTVTNEMGNVVISKSVFKLTT
jgi:hypothetical protein